ncbi:hypothetical protein H9P43_008282 [Blastocladiella emersonii ATCC 22665]|nr:hypothetical protein H9P43_008282 [Blastocladiella emersonii ATCC 22665]
MPAAATTKPPAAGTGKRGSGAAAGNGPTAAPVVRNRRSSMVTQNPNATAIARAGSFSKRGSLALSPSFSSGNPNSSGNSGGGEGGGGRRNSLAPHIMEMLERPTYDMSDTRVDARAESAALDADMAAVRATIGRLEREIRDTFTTRRVVTSSTAYFPDAPAAAAAGPGGAVPVVPPPAAFGGGGGNAAAGDATLGSGEDVVLRAKAELMRHRDRMANEEEEREQIQATRHRFQENASLIAAGPKYVYNFVSFFGDVMHVELVSVVMAIVFTSRGFIEVWKVDVPNQWRLADHWQLGPHYPRVTVVTPLFLSRNEQAHLVQNRMHYLKPPDDASAPMAAANDADDEDEGDEYGESQTSESEADLASEAGDAVPATLAPKPSAMPAAPAASKATTPSHSLPPSSRPSKTADDLVLQLTSTTYDMGGNVAVSDEQAVRRSNYYSFVVSWAGTRASSVGGCLVERPLFLVGCGNGEVSLVELTVAEDQVSGERSVRHRILDRAMVSVGPIVHATYFAPGHHAVVGVTTRDAMGRLQPELVGFTVPTLKPAFRSSLGALVAEARDMAGGGPAASATDSAIALSTLAADNVQLRLYLGVGDLFIQCVFDSLPLITEATFFNADADVNGGGADGMPAVVVHEDPPELVVAAAHSLRAHETDDDDEDADNDAASSAGGSTSSLRRDLKAGVGAFGEDLIEVSSICPITSPFTFRPYVLIGCYDASVRCLSANDPTEEIFYYNSDIAAKAARAAMTVTALCPSRDAQLALTTCADGTMSVLSIDRRVLLNEHRLLTSRGTSRSLASAAAVVGSGMLRGAGAVSNGALAGSNPNVSSAADGSGGGGASGGGASTLAPPGSRGVPGSSNLNSGGGGGTGASSRGAATGGGGVERRKIFVGDLEHAWYAVAAGNEWSLLRAPDLIKWLDGTPISQQDYVIM